MFTELDDDNTSAVSVDVTDDIFTGQCCHSFLVGILSSFRIIFKRRQQTMCLLLVERY